MAFPPSFIDELVARNPIEDIVGQYVTQNHVGTTLSLTVEAYAVQSEHNPAEHPWEAAGWPAA